MFNLSFSEICLIIILAIIFLKPDDIPVLVKSIKNLFNKILTIKSYVLDEIDFLKDEFKDLEDELKEQNKILKEKANDDRK